MKQGSLVSFNKIKLMLLISISLKSKESESSERYDKARKQKNI